MAQPDTAAPASPQDLPGVAARDDELGRLLLDKPAVPITKPRDPQVQAPPGDTPIDGSVVVNQLCRVTYRQDTGWYLLTFLPAADQQPAAPTDPRWVLPSKWLEAVEKELAGEQSGVFEVTGETTVYRGRAFIALANLKRPRQEPPTAPPEEPAPDGQVGSRGSGGSAEPTEADGVADRPGGAPQASAAPGAAVSRPFEEIPSSANLVAAKLLGDRPGRPVHVPRDSGPVAAEPSVAPGGLGQLNEDRGEMRVDRLIVLASDPSDQWREARFISDNTLQDQPVRLLPCRQLEIAEKLAAASKRKGATVRLRASGVLSQYKGQQYMLLRKAVVERDMGQF